MTPMTAAMPSDRMQAGMRISRILMEFCAVKCGITEVRSLESILDEWFAPSSPAGDFGVLCVAITKEAIYSRRGRKAECAGSRRGRPAHLARLMVSSQ
ncbi:hypothetical protein MPC4_190081 [Methylocella tundrae]|uniref:Uncharacterized protein n=1 Tax=Methylocella tundrae TaxID=227605 RepID=A0A8B6M4J8_METTU|nr:hypothetical protein MPC4_190081 [Methylocella tundrae]